MGQHLTKLNVYHWACGDEETERQAEPDRQADARALALRVKAITRILLLYTKILSVRILLFYTCVLILLCVLTLLCLSYHALPSALFFPL